MDVHVIKQAVSGNSVAIQAVLNGSLRHALSVARRFADDRDEAEDLAQEILMRIYRSLPSLKDPDRFWGWASVVARRVCADWKRQEQRRSLALGGLLITDEREDPSVASDPFRSPEEDALEDERRQGIRKALKTLSAQNRLALELFYVEGLSLRAIAERLGISEQAAKQRLYAGRTQIREELSTMPETVEERQQATANRPLRFSRWGESPGETPYNPYVLTRSLLSQQILLCIAKSAMTPQALAQKVGADLVYIADCLSDLVTGELVRREGEDRYVADFFMLDRDDQEALRARAREIGKKDAEIIVRHAGEIRDAFGRCAFEASGFSWETMRWILIPTLTGNLGVRRANSEVFDVHPPVRHGGSRWFFFGESRDLPPQEWVAGCNMSYDEDGGGAHLWTPAIQRSHSFLPDRKARQVIDALSEGPRSLSAIASAVDTTDVRTEIAEMIDAGWIAKEGDDLRLAVPLFTEAEDRILRPAIDAIGREIADRSWRSGLDGLDGVLNALGFEGLRPQYPAMRALVASKICGFCFESLVASGLLGSPPEPVPPAWGCWAWKGSLEIIRSTRAPLLARS